MTQKLTLRLREDDARALDKAAERMAGPAGAPYVGRMKIIRATLAAFNAQHRPEIGEERTA